MDKLKKDILRLLRKHRKLSRQELATLTGENDRIVRKAIGELREEGHMIGITSSGGYSINNKTDFHRAIAIYKARAGKEQKRIKAMQRTLEHVGQLRMQI